MDMLWAYLLWEDYFKLIFEFVIKDQFYNPHFSSVNLDSITFNEDKGSVISNICIQLTFLHKKSMAFRDQYFAESYSK